MDTNQAKLNATLEKLVERIDSYHREKNNSVQQTTEIFNKLDSLVDSISKLEAQQSTEAKLANKIDSMNKYIDKMVTQQQRQEKQVEFEDTLRRVLNGAKITGKVIESVASSADAVFDTISHMLKEGNKGGAVSRQQASNENFDLASFLKPLNSLIQGFANVGANSSNNYDSGYSAGSKEDGTPEEDISQQQE